MTPNVSVLLPVYNCEAYITEAIDSILGQTFKDFELVIINDGSTDSSEEIILSYSDHRIRYEKNALNSGIITTLNRGLRLCRGKYIARMDADDISYPTRLQKQVDFLDSHSEIGVLGSAVQCFSSSGLGEIMCYETNPHKLFSSFLFAESSMLAHPAVMMRRDLFLANDIQYSDSYLHAEDYSLWNELKYVSQLSNLEEPLLLYRLHGDSISCSFCQAQTEARAKIALSEYKKLIREDLHEYENMSAKDIFVHLKIRQLNKLFWALTRNIGLSNAMILIFNSLLKAKVFPIIIKLKNSLKRR